MDLSKPAGSGSFPQRLRELRDKRGLSQQAVADFCQLSKSTVANYERGRRTPSITDAVILADFFGVSLDYLAGRSDCMR